MKNGDIDSVMKILLRDVKAMPLPAITEIRMQHGRDAYKILIATMLSLRTKDTTTLLAAKRLFAKAPDAKTMRALTQKQIETLIYPVGFYHIKAKNILETSNDILTRFQGAVPNTIDELLTLNGVGRKTANLVVTEAFNKDGICVDTHVHRISNRLGYTHTKTPYDTEMALRAKLPKKYWRSYNDTLVVYGQNRCRPVGPRCGECNVTRYCDYYAETKNDAR